MGFVVRCALASTLLVIISGTINVAFGDPPVLITQQNSTRAVALDSPTFRREPFPLISPVQVIGATDERTRVMLFALNLAGADASTLTVDAEDEAHRHYNLKVEYVGQVQGSGLEQLSQIIVRLGEDLGNVGDVLVRLTYHGVSSNRARIGIGFVGGGLPDDNYQISGQVLSNGVGLGGVMISLGGSASTTTVTDSAGRYSLTNLSPLGGYTVTPSKPNYTFSAQSLSFSNLTENQTANFNASLLSYNLGGRITDKDGAPLSGVTVNLSGSETYITTTDTNGNYSFTVKAEGDYLIMPLTTYYIFKPASQFFSKLGGNQVVNFTTADLFYVLDFDGSPQTVDYGFFWPSNVDLGNFFWEFWAMPGANTFGRYMISDGYGGAHALLFGFTSAADGSPRYGLYGNVFDGSTVMAFGSDDGPAPNEWGHYAVGWDGHYIVTYYNGVPVGRTAFTGPRKSPDNGGAGKLLIGGSDHNNLIGRIAQVRGWEGKNPLQLQEVNGNRITTASFIPETLFGITNNSGGPSASFLTNFLRPSPLVPDLAGGRVGLLRGVGFGIPDPRQTYPLPQFVIDSSAPNTSPATGPVAPTGLVDQPKPVPAQARVFDSFSRRNSTYAFEGIGGLGSTEGGTAGPQIWQPAVPETQYARLPFGILNGHAVILENAPRATWVSTGDGPANLDIRVDRHRGFYESGISTGIVFRHQDVSNFFYAYTAGSSDTSQVLVVGYYFGSDVVRLVNSVPMPTNWTTLRVVTLESGTIEVYADSILVASTSSSVLATAKNAGLWSADLGTGLANRWDNFTVYDAK